MMFQIIAEWFFAGGWILIAIGVFFVIALVEFVIVGILYILYASLVPIMMLSALQLGLQRINDNERRKTITLAIFYQSPLMIWVTYYIKVTTNNFTLEPGMIVLEVIYIMIMLWFFCTISLKAIQIKEYSMVLNPLIAIFSLIFSIISLPFLLIYSIYQGFKLWYQKLILCWQNFRRIRDDELHENLIEFHDEEQNVDQGYDQQENQIEHQIEDQAEWAICKYPIFQNEGTPAVLPCGHLFHFECIDYWIGIREQNICPFDRRPTFRNQIVRLII